MIEAIELTIPGCLLDETSEVLHRYGNVSSPSVLEAMKEALENPRSAGNHFWLTAFGAGFAAHSCALRRD